MHKSNILGSVIPHDRLLHYIQELPVGAIVDRVNEELKENSAIVVTAPPGAGKSTLLPLTISENSTGKTIVLEPRRIVARHIAERMSDMIESAVGDIVGYRVRYDKKVSDSTRIEVVTEGMLTRKIVADPMMEGISTVIFDEFHERSINTDTALALVRETQQTIRPDLKIVIMSATIDAQNLCEVLEAPLIESDGRLYDVEVRYCEDADPGNCAESVARTIKKAYMETSGSILAFLPGQRDIFICQKIVQTLLPTDVDVLPLFGQLSLKEQKHAIMPARKGVRKVVLATSIAETSLTIEGITVVIDSGFCRKPVFSPRNGLGRLETVRISMDRARQRSGRAGRLTSGICYRLWSKATEERMPECGMPEIMEADLASTVLDIAAWGGNDINRMLWLTPPPTAHVMQAVTLLNELGALDNGHLITPKGRKLSELPCHPRIANMLTECKTDEMKSLAADIAALLEEKDPVSNENDADINTRLVMLRDARKSRKPGIWKQIIRIAEQYRQMAHVKENNDLSTLCYSGSLVASAYPERLAIVHGLNTYRLACGEKVTLSQNDDLHGCKTLAVAALDKRIFLASPVDDEVLGKYAKTHDRVVWDSAQGRVCAVEETRIGCLVIHTKQKESVRNEDALAVTVDVIKKEGSRLLEINEKLGEMQKRIATVARWHPELALPDVSTDRIYDTADEWLPMYVGCPITCEKLRKIDLTDVVWGWLTYEQQKEVDSIAPSHIIVPTGSRIRIDYREETGSPVLSVRLQECFGMVETPCVDRGKVPLLMELLSPGFKPVQLTTDLHSFWNNTYFEVRKELKRRYPKHYWPDNPLEAEAVRGVKRHK